MSFFSLLSNPAKAERLMKALILVPNIFPLVHLAENTFAGSGRGAEKKQFVLQSVNFMTDALEAQGYLTPEMNQGLDKIAGELTDTIAAFLKLKTDAATAPAEKHDTGAD